MTITKRGKNMPVLNPQLIKKDAQQMFRVRVEATDTKLYSEYYEISDMPSDWVTMNQDEKHMWLRRHGALINSEIEELQERTDGVFLSWDKSHPEWTVVFTTSSTQHAEIISAPDSPAAIAAAREHIKSTCGNAYSTMLELTASVTVQSGRYGL
jgi:hypothetical protein